MQDEETGQARKRTSSMDMQGLTRWEVHKKMLNNNKEGKYFKLSKVRRTAGATAAHCPPLY